MSKDLKTAETSTVERSYGWKCVVTRGKRSHDGSMVLPYGAPWIPSIYLPMLALIYQHHGSVMGTGFLMNKIAIQNDPISWKSMNLFHPFSGWVHRMIKKPLRNHWVVWTGKKRWKSLRLLLPEKLVVPRPTPKVTYLLQLSQHFEKACPSDGELWTYRRVAGFYSRYPLVN